MSYLVDSHDVIFLPFDNYAGEDLCGNSWNVYSLTIGTSNAKDGKAAQLNFGPNMSIYQSQGVYLGGQDFTIDCWLYVDSSTSAWGRIFELNNGTNEQRIELARSDTSNNLYLYSWFGNCSFTISNCMNTLFHFALVYEHSQSKATVYKNGVSVGSNTINLSRTFFPNLNIGYSYYDSSAHSKGAVDCFRVADDYARWTSGFTPPSVYQVDDINLSVDTSRKVNENQSVLADTLRIVDQSGDPVSISVDTNREIVESQSISADTLRSIQQADDVSISVDTQRKVSEAQEIHADTYRIIEETTNISADTQRVIPHVVTDNSSDLQSIEIDITTQQITDNITFNINGSMDIMEYIEGNYLDYYYMLRVEETNKTGVIQSCKCTTDLDELLYKSITYKVNGTQYKEEEKKMASASTHISSIANHLGLNLVTRFSGFISTLDCEQYNVMYKNLISDLFGWSSRIPTLLINAYIRNNTLYVIQRGHEANTIDVTNLDRTVPTVHREITRLFYGNTTTKLCKTPYLWGDNLVQPLQDTEDTHYEYTAGLLRRKTTTNILDNTKTVTEYEYSLHNSKDYLSEEIETLYKWKQNFNIGGEWETVEVRKTEHVPLWNGQMETRVYIDGELTGSTLSKGDSNNIPSEYIMQKERTVFSEETEYVEHVSVDGAVTFDSVFPVYSNAVLEDLADEVKWLNRRTKETVTFDLYNYNHVIDFDDRIILNGNTYYLDSNVVRKTPTIKNVQSLTIVRWF